MTRFARLALEPIGALGTFAPYARPYAKLPSPDEAWRRDWSRLGLDLGRVIERHHEKTAKDAAATIFRDRSRAAAREGFLDFLDRAGNEAPTDGDVIS